MDFVTVNGVKIAFYEQGAGEPLVLIRGYTQNAAMWYDQVPDLSREFRVITYDQRDTGNSQAVDAPYTVADMAEDVAGVIRTSNVGPVHLFGLSMGGMIAQALTLSHPDLVKTLILGCTTCSLKTGFTQDPKVLAQFVTDPDLSDEENARKSLPALFSPQTLSGAKDVADRYAREALANRPPLATFVRHQAAMQSFNVCDQLHRIAVPTLIAHGTGDQLLPVKNAHQLKELIPHAKLKLYEGLGHLYFHEAPATVNRDIIEFIKQAHS